MDLYHHILDLSAIEKKTIKVIPAQIEMASVEEKENIIQPVESKEMGKNYGKRRNFFFLGQIFIIFWLNTLNPKSQRHRLCLQPR